MKTAKNEQFWISVAEQLRRFRKGESTKQELIDMFPELEFTNGWRKYDFIKEAIKCTIPQECPLSLIPKIVISACEEEQDVYRTTRLYQRGKSW